MDPKFKKEGTNPTITKRKVGILKSKKEGTNPNTEKGRYES